MISRLIVLFFIVGSLNTFAQNHTDIKAMTFNIRYASPNDGINIWENRRDWLCSSIDFFDVDVFGAQEVIKSQLNDMVKRLPEYAHIGIGRNGGNEGEFCPVFYKKTTFDLLDSGTFWLSETPSVTNSKGWDAALPRIITWVKLKHLISGKEFYFFNAHFDHKGVTARLESAKLLKKMVKKIAKNESFLISGDFNLPPSSEAYSELVDQKDANIKLLDSKLRAKKIYGPSYSFNGYLLEPDEERERIDYIFSSEDVTILKHHTIDGQRGGKYISDHFPILVDARFQ
ncbi:endonuclease/exonuclease/phosphatase family protein [Maribacter sp. ANRC-HE7]|uniref:Endonuclease/exonuclease/phosphatase family protein n=1 Tax=Maribacter aquimaris TaxID=2737171 RepID=A0ABR7UXQ8_9FLAO|nr:endonuclease/exonuclease/phosphatase family protein [Maribacter aquimaris]MBD0777372.1 endonuclease/exonuclease/phosphatase family protein [Maribacter aquimaris]